MDQAKSNSPHAIYIDVDGCLTDGVLTIDHTGEKLFKHFHTRDVRAIRELIFNGFEVTLITADEWPGIRHFANKVGAGLILARDKGSAVPDEFFAAIGDDAWDVTMLGKAHRAFCPADADESILQLPGITVLNTNGGRGVVAELVRILVH